MVAIIPDYDNLDTTWTSSATNQGRISNSAPRSQPWMVASFQDSDWLVVLTILKNMTSSVGMMIHPNWIGQIKVMFQTSNQVNICE